MRIRPTKNRLVVEVLVVHRLTERGFELPDTVKEWVPPQQGRVLHVGREVTKTRVGEKVLFGLEAGEEYNGVLILHESDIVCEMD